MLSKKTLLIIGISALGCLLFWWGTQYFQRSQLNAKIHFLNVGQGDAILIESITNETVLIDTGPDNRVVYELGDALPANDKTIETLVITHPDMDHSGGAIAVINHYNVGRILTSGFKASSSNSQKIVAAIRAKKIPLIAVDKNSDFSFENGEKDGVFDVLYPLSPVIYSSEKANNDSVVMRLNIVGTSFLFTGDIEAEIEEKLLRTYTKGELDVDVLKLAHHGSKTSSIEDFLKATSPKLAIASVGKKNRYGHPHPIVLERLKSLRIPLRRTDLEGRITLDLQ